MAGIIRKVSGAPEARQARTAQRVIPENVSSTCPYCGEPVELTVDPDGGGHQVFVEDCPVCCRPWQVEVIEQHGGGWMVTLRTSDE